MSKILKMSVIAVLLFRRYWQAANQQPHLLQ